MAGNTSATVSWTAPSNGGSTITSYTITPSIGSTAQTPTTVTGNPPATTATITGLTNGTAYTFTVTATNAVGTGPGSAPSNAVTPSAPTVPGAPSAVTALARNASATLSWTAPSNGGSTITSYTITPSIGSTAQTPTTVTGNPPATTATITGLTNGTSYTFTVTATNAIGTGPASTPSNAVTPTVVANPVFVQQTSARQTGTSLTLTPTSNITLGNRLIVQVGVWSSGNATTSLVTDSAGNTWTKLTSVIAADHTELSIWSAPITAGGGTKPTITVTPTGTADIGAAALEYAGLSTASGAAVLDVSKTATGTTSAAATVASGATPATTAGPELAIGFYVDSGFGDTLTPGTGWTGRVNVSPTGDMELLTEDQIVNAAGTPNATIGTGPNTLWSAAALVLKSASGGLTAPGAPTGVSAVAGNTSASVSWTAPSNGGSTITSYTITPSIGSTAQTPTTVTGNPPATTATITGLTNGTSYTFTVTATNGVGTGPGSAPSNAVTPSAPTVPGAPSAVTALARNASATLSWTAPSNGGSTITSYTITPSIGSTAQTPTTVTGNPPATTATITGLTNGTSYTFTVTATNAIGTGPASTPSNAVTPTVVANPVFVQQTSARQTGTSLTLTPTSNITLGNRLIVQVGVWSSGNATTSLVTDSAGNTWTKLTSVIAADHTELSIWSAPITAGGGTKPTITVTPTGTADIGAAALEYAGLSTASGAAVLDVSKTATGTTSAAATVASGATPATTAGPELAIGFYVDSGFGDTLTPGTGWTGRVNVSPTGDMELLTEDQIVNAAGTPNATIGTGPNTLWSAAALVLKHA